MKKRKNSVSSDPDESEPLLQLKGLNGHIDLFEEHLVIKRSLVHKVMRNKLSGKYSLPLSQISEIHFRRTSIFETGYIRFIPIGKDASYLSFLTKDKDDGTVLIAKSSNDFVVRFVSRVCELNSSINVFDLDDPEAKGQRDIANKVADMANSGLSYANRKVKEVDSDKIIKGAVFAGAFVGEEVVKKKLNLKYKGNIASNVMMDHIFKSDKKSTNSDTSDCDNSEK